MTVQASTFNVPLEALADSVMWLRERVRGEFNTPLAAVFATGFAFTLTGGPGTNAHGYGQTSAAGSPLVQIPIPIPRAGHTSVPFKLTSVRVRYRVATGHGALPAGLPALAVRAQGASGGAAVDIFTPVSDAAGDVATYEAAGGRELICTGTSNLTTSDAYYLTFAGESGANSITGLLLTLAACTFEVA
jgi:hypothetical protein